MDGDGLPAPTTPEAPRAHKVDLTTPRPSRRATAPTSSDGPPPMAPVPPQELLPTLGPSTMMNRHPPHKRQDRRQARITNLTLVQHNSLGSWDVFLSWFNSFVEFSTVDIVLLQDPPVYHGSLPSFVGIKAFAPPVFKGGVACYVALGFCKKYSLLPAFIPRTDDVLFLDIFTLNGFLDISALKFRIENVYSHSLTQPPSNTVPPATALADHDFPYQVVGDFNIHNPASDPLRVISCAEEQASAPYFDQVPDLGYILLNTSVVLTSYPVSGGQRPSVIDLACANPLMFPAFRSWDASIPPLAQTMTQ